MLRRLAAVLLLAAVPQLPLTTVPVGSSWAAGGVECRGQQATHVGSPGQPLVTTSGPDVVVTNGTRRIDTGDGDDVICVTGGGQSVLTVVPGAGDDVVDSTAYTGYNLRTFLGVLNEVGSSGDDVYVGGDRSDKVLVFSGTAEDHKVIDTAGEEDTLKVGEPYAGTVVADLGSDHDNYVANALREGVTVEGGIGRDYLRTDCPGCQTAGFDLPTGAVTTDDVASGTAAGFQVLSLFRRRLLEITVVGDGAGNSITVVACTADVRGRGGRDALFVHAASPVVCDAPSATIHGDAGNDALGGTVGDDLLIGGPGIDQAYANDGTDTCRTERRRDCEN